MRKPDFKLNFRELSENENLYDDVDLSKCSIVPAQYRRVPGYEDNPDVCAIPRRPFAEEIITAGTVPMRGYDSEKAGGLKSYEKKEQIADMQHVSCVLGIHFRTASVINKYLLESYKGRDVMITLHNNNKKNYLPDMRTVLISTPNPLSGRTDGFLISGVTGCGKSMSLSLCCEMYPKAIRHSFKDCEYIQIPIIRVTALVGNLTAVYRSIAKIIDKILDTGDAHLSRVRTANLGIAATYIKEWIELYHVGLLIIDEIQFFHFGGQNNSFENIIAITEDTGVAFGLIGNNEVLDKALAMPRILSRVVKDHALADINSENDEKIFAEAVKKLWEYQWGKEHIPLTTEILSELIYQSSYNIALLKALLVFIQYALVTRKDVTVNREFIEKIASKNLHELRSLIRSPSVENDKEFKKRLKKLYGEISSEADTEFEVDQASGLIRRRDRKTEKVIEDVSLAISQIYTEYSYSQARRAVIKAIDNEQMTCRDTGMVARSALEILGEGRGFSSGSHLPVVTSQDLNESLERSKAMYFIEA